MNRNNFTDYSGYVVVALALLWLAFRIWKDSNEQKKN